MRLSKPGRDGLMDVRTIWPEHLGQRWRWTAIRLGSNKIARDGMMARSVQAGALQNSQSPAVAVRGGDEASMEPANLRRCSILLTFQGINVLLENEETREVDPWMRLNREAGTGGQIGRQNESGIKPLCNNAPQRTEIDWPNEHPACSELRDLSGAASHADDLRTL
jgi:hypothetical protein